MKHQAAKLVTELGMVMEVKLLQPSKQPYFNAVMESGMMIEVKPEQ